MPKKKVSSNPLFTIITPSFNSGKYLEETIKSVLRQTYKNIEFIVIDGGSKDNSIDIIKKYESKISYWISEPDNGQTDAINKGFSMAKGDLVGWLCSDDVLFENSIELIVDYVNKNSLTVDNIGVIFGNTTHFNGDTIISKTNGARINLKYILTKNPQVIQPGSFHSAAILKKVGRLNEKLKYCMDYDLWIRTLKYGNSFFVNEQLAKFRVHQESKSVKDRLYFALELMKVNFRYKKNPFAPIKFLLMKRILREWLKAIKSK